MPQQYTFSNGVVMIGWDPALLANQPPAERRAAWQARWGGKHLSCPPQNPGCREETLRRKCWPHKNNGDVRSGSTAKCWFCFFGNKPMPVGAANIPVGMDDEDLLPCGCEWKFVAVELFMKYNVDSLAQYDKARNSIGQASAPSTIPHEVRVSIWETLEHLQGGNMTVLDMLTGANRIAKTQAAINGGAAI